MRWATAAVTVLVCLWVLAWPNAVLFALRTPWAGWGEVPTPDQVAEGVSRARDAGVVGVTLPVLAAVVAAWNRMRVTTALLLTGALVAAAFSGVLYALAHD
ncbi:hypothetical protein [Modestobacter sp. SYSU DS0290]